MLVTLWVCVKQKVDFPWLCVTRGRAQGLGDTPREMQLWEMIFIMCTDIPSICLQPCSSVNLSVGWAKAAPSHPRGLHLRVSPRACTWINQHLSPVSIALYLPASVYLHAGACISHNRYSESLIWWVKWSGLFDQPSGSITTRASAGAGITTYIWLISGVKTSLLFDRMTEIV